MMTTSSLSRRGRKQRAQNREEYLRLWDSMPESGLLCLNCWIAKSEKRKAGWGHEWKWEWNGGKSGHIVWEIWIMHKVWKRQGQMKQQQQQQHQQTRAASTANWDDNIHNWAMATTTTTTKQSCYGLNEYARIVNWVASLYWPQNQIKLHPWPHLSFAASKSPHSSHQWTAQKANQTNNQQLKTGLLY